MRPADTPAGVRGKAGEPLKEIEFEDESPI